MDAAVQVRLPIPESRCWWLFRIPRTEIEMMRFLEKAFLNNRLTFRLSVLADEAIRSNDPIFVRATGCTIREIRVLRLIDDHPGITFIEICRVTGLERSLTSRIIRRLLALEFVQREGVEADARRYQLSTTSKGKSCRKDARTLSDGLESRLLQPLNATELATLTELLERLANWVRSPEYAKLLTEYPSATAHSEPTSATARPPRSRRRTG